MTLIRHPETATADRRETRPLLFLAIAVTIASVLLFPPAPASAALVCETDVDGPDDAPSQSDVNRQCEDAAPGTGDLQVTWNWDDTALPGGNTGDACALFDSNTDSDDFIDFAICVTIGGDPAIHSGVSPRIYECGNDNVDRCSQPVEGLPLGTSSCTVTRPADSDPFRAGQSPAHGAGGNLCNGTDCKSVDAVASCTIFLVDVGGTSVEFTNVCSYNSQEANSNPVDCVLPPLCGGVDCSGTATACATFECNPVSGACNVPTFAPNTTQCQGSAGVCDRAEFCTGSSATCPADGANLTSVCRASAGECDLAESCSNSSDDCPIDGANLTTECRASAGECDLAEFCSNSSDTCPIDGDNLTTECRASAGECDLAESCSNSSDTCPIDGDNLTTECRASAGECDLAESCSNSSDTCPIDGDNLTTECRASAGECDLAESCSNASNDCPIDGDNLTTECRAAAGECDLAESCSNSSDDCPIDGDNLTTECRAAAGECDLAESCSNSSDDCPIDGDNLTTECRASAGECDLAESCSNSSDDCPIDGDNLTTECRAAAGECDLAESCSNSSDDCPIDGNNLTTECRAAAGECDLAESCSNSSDDCPIDGDNLTTECRASAGDCDLAESCSNSSDDCPIDGNNLTSVCRAAAGDCDVAESCSNSSDDCPADAFRPEDYTCGDTSTGACTDPNTCDGDGNCVANNKPCGWVTDSSLCTFDDLFDRCADVDRDFRLIYTPDVKIYPGYKMNATNPGQYYYNLIYDGTPGDETTITINIPWPFVTHGATPLHVYDGEDVAIDNCFVPGQALAEYKVRFSLDNYYGPTQPASEIPVTCDPLGQAGVCTPEAAADAHCTFDVTATIPDSGQLYINLHLDYPLASPNADLYPCYLIKQCSNGAYCSSNGDCLTGTDGICKSRPDRYDYYANGITGGLDSVVETSANPSTGADAVDDCRPYPFSHDGDLSDGADTVNSFNEFKKIAGAFGLAKSSSTGTGFPNANITLTNSKGQVVASSKTDNDGFYLLAYKHTGKPSLYNVTLSYPACGSSYKKQIELQGNGWSNVDFDTATCTSTAEYGAGRNQTK